MESEGPISANKKIISKVRTFPFETTDKYLYCLFHYWWMQDPKTRHILLLYAAIPRLAGLLSRA